MDIKKLLQNKMFKILLGVIGAIVLLIIVIMIVFAIRGTRVSGYAVLEEKMVAAARAYYKENSDKLPKEVGGKSEVDHTTLTAEGHLKNLQNISPKGSTCTGRVIVKNVNHGYFYQAFLDCFGFFTRLSLIIFQTHRFFKPFSKIFNRFCSIIPFL